MTHYRQSSSGCEHSSALPPQATPIATTLSQRLPQSFFNRHAEQVAPELIGCLLVKREPNGELLWAVLMETEAYFQDEPSCHGYRRRTPSNETLLGEPGRFCVYMNYAIHDCVKVVSVVAHGRAIPLLWQTLEHPSASVSASI